MSHIAEVKTEIRSLEIALQTLEQLGHKVHPAPFTMDVWTDQDRKRECAAGFLLQTGADLHAGKQFGFGFEAQPDGSYQIVGDAYCLLYCVEDTATGRAYLTDPRNKDHAAFLQLYAENVALMLAGAYGMSAERITDETDAVTLILRGGMMLAHEEMHIRCLPSGGCEISMHGCIDSSCYQRTADFESALGATLADTRHLDLAHDGAGSHLSRVAQ